MRDVTAPATAVVVASSASKSATDKTPKTETTEKTPIDRVDSGRATLKPTSETTVLALALFKPTPRTTMSLSGVEQALARLKAERKAAAAASAIGRRGGGDRAPLCGEAQPARRGAGPNEPRPAAEAEADEIITLAATLRSLQAVSKQVDAEHITGALAKTRLPLLFTASAQQGGGKPALKRYIELLSIADDTHGLPLLLIPEFHRFVSELALMDTSTAAALCTRLHFQVHDPCDKLKREMLGWRPEASPTRGPAANQQLSDHSGGAGVFCDALSSAHWAIETEATTAIAREVLYRALSFGYECSAKQHRASEILAMRELSDRIDSERERAAARVAQPRANAKRARRRQRRKTRTARQRDCEVALGEVREAESDGGSSHAAPLVALRVWTVVVLVALAVVLGVGAALAFTSSSGSRWGGAVSPCMAPHVNASLLTHEVERQSAETYSTEQADFALYSLKTDGVRAPLAHCEEVSSTCGRAALSIA